MNITIKQLVILSTFIFASSCKFIKDNSKDDVLGCVDEAAYNYNPEATTDDGSCSFCAPDAWFLLISTDGGYTWNINCSKEFSSLRAHDISAIDSSHIWITRSEYLNGNELDQILFTSDQGKTWEVQLTFPGDGYDGGADYIEMFDKKNGVAKFSRAGTQLFVTNDGETWNKVETPDLLGRGTVGRRKIDFIDKSTGYFINTKLNPNILYKTTNLGETWETTEFDKRHTISVLQFFNENIGLIIGINNTFRTTDGAQTWEKLPHHPFYDGYMNTSLKFNPKNPSEVWHTQLNNIYFSSDTGRTWNKQEYRGGHIDIHVYNNKAWLSSDFLSFSNNPKVGQWEEIIPMTEFDFPIKSSSLNMVDGYQDKVIATIGIF